MPRRNEIMTNEEFLNKINTDVVEILGQYTGCKNKIQVKCKKCGNIWYCLPGNIRRLKNGCSNCSRKELYHNRRLTNEEFCNEIYKMYGDEYSVLSSYKNVRTKIKVRHNKCGFEYEIWPSEFKNAKRQCRKCQGLLKTHEDFVKEVYLLVNNEYTVLGKYKNALTKVKIRHNKCGNIYEVKPSNFTSSQSRCPKCIESKGENKIKEWLNSNNIKYKHQYKFNDLLGPGGRQLSYDFAILNEKENIKMLIEYDGEFHTKVSNRKGSDLMLQLQRDAIKSDYAKNKKIKLIRITPKDYDDIEKILTNLLIL